MSYAELQITTNLSFKRGASYPDEYFNRAVDLGMAALGITDRNSLAGIVRAHEAARGTGLRLVVGCRLDLADGLPLLVYPTDRAAYARLCRLLRIGKFRPEQGKWYLTWADFCAESEGLLAILLPDQADANLEAQAQRLRRQCGDRAYLALTLRRRADDQLRLFQLSQLAQRCRVRTVVTNDVLYHDPSRRQLQDVITCIREGCTIDAAGFRRERFADRYLKSPAEMARLFKAYPEALERTGDIVARCRFSLDELHYSYPDESDGTGETAQQSLERLTWEGAAERYADGIPAKVAEQLRHELSLIQSLNYAPYFLTVHNIVRFARSKGILCQGRGSAANSAVCFVLAITAINPIQNTLLFERFVSLERREPPDIDVDFDSDRREEVIQWIYETYGRNRAALAAVVITYRMKSAIRDIGKVLGLPEDTINLINKQIWAWGREAVGNKQLNGLNLNRDDRRLQMTLELAHQLAGFPSHFSQHPGGFVLANFPLDELVPVQPATMKDRQIIEWDKNDIDTLKFMKVDVLGLGMLGCLSRAFDLLKEHRGQDLTLADIPEDDQATYDMICRADTIGVFQIESRAQMSMLPRLKPRSLYDLTIEVAIVRPGPIQGDMVHPYLRRRNGTEPTIYPSADLQDILGKTLGVPLFQEQAMTIAIRCAGFTPGEADQLRREMATFKLTYGVTKFKDKFIDGMIANGYDADFAARCFKQIEGFGSYGFPESHAASFALLAYTSSWFKCRHPDIFCCALLNAQPMGFYAPPQIIGDAKAHGVEVRPIDVNHSHWDHTLEPAAKGPYKALRLGLRLIDGLPNADGALVATARGEQPYESVEDVQLRAGIGGRAIDALAKADAFTSCRLNRRQAHWTARALHQKALPLFAAGAAISEPSIALPAMTAGKEVMEDYAHTGLTLRQHPLHFLRAKLAAQGVVPNDALKTSKNSSLVTVAGLVLVRQKPGSAKGTMFMTIEDETGYANLIIWPALFEQERRLLLSSRLVACTGKLQREGQIVHVVARHFSDQDALLRLVPSMGLPAQLDPKEQALTDKMDFGLRNFC